jgi:hypothetical protein
MIDPYCCNNQWDEKCQQLYWRCSDDSDLDVRDLMRSNSVVLYPVPVGNYLNILTKSKVDIEVYDITGRLVIKVRPNQTHKGLNRLDTHLLKPGVYSFTIKYQGKTSTKKVIKR